MWENVFYLYRKPTVSCSGALLRHLLSSHNKKDVRARHAALVQSRPLALVACRDRVLRLRFCLCLCVLGILGPAALPACCLPLFPATWSRPCHTQHCQPCNPALFSNSCSCVCIRVCGFWCVSTSPRTNPGLALYHNLRILTAICAKLGN